MLRTILTIAACSLLATIVSGQQKIGDNTLILDPASLLELESTSQGFLPSRLTTIQRDAQTEWDEGHIIYNTTETCLQIYNGSSWDCFVQGVIIDSTIYKYNGALTDHRTVTMNGKNLTFDGSGGDVVITEAGFIGIGDPTPEAKLDVEGGTVRLSDYGSGTNNGSESYFLGVDSDGDVIEITPAIDTFLISNDTLKLSLKSDAVSFKYVDLSPYTADNQVIDSLGLTGTNLELSIEGDGEALKVLDLSSINTDDQKIDSIALTGTTLEISLEDDSEALKTVDLSSLQDGSGTDDQILDSLGLSGTTLQIEVEGDVNGLQSLDLAPILDSAENIYNTSDTLEGNRIVTLDGNSLTFNAAGTKDLLIEADGDIAIGTSTANAELQIHGDGTESAILLTSPLIGTSASDGLYLGITDADAIGWIWNYENADLSFGTNNDTILTLKPTGQAQLLDYGTDSFLDNSPARLLAVQADGDIVETNMSLVGTDDQILDSLGLTGTTLEVGIEGDVNGLQTLDLSSLQDGTGTDDQILDSLGLTGTTLEVGIEGDVNGLQTLDLSSLQDGTGTDDQILDSLGLTGNTLEIGIEGDINGLQSLDLTPILGSSENIYNTSDSLEANRVVTMDGNSLTFDGAGTGDFVIQSDGDIGIGTTTPSGDLGVTSDEDQDAFNFTQTTGTTGERDVLTIEDQDAGDGTQDESSVLKVVKSGNINSADNGFSLVELANTGADPGASKYWISGRKTDEGAPLWGVDITDNDFWSEGGIVLGVTGADGGTYSGGNFIVEPDGDVGIGTTTPGARLNVTGGSVIFNEYGVGTYNDTTADYTLVVDASGNVKEINTAKNTRWFYPPPVIIDASSTVTSATYDVHAAYVDQFTNTATFVKSPGAGAALPVYQEDELGYFVTFYDDTILDNVSISNAGVLTYDIISIPDDNYTVITIVFEIL